MPKMDGIELTTTIRKINKDIPIIFITAHDVIDIEPSVLKFLNIEDIIIKPIKMKDLMGKINIIKQKIIVES